MGSYREIKGEYRVDASDVQSAVSHVMRITPPELEPEINMLGLIAVQLAYLNENIKQNSGYLAALIKLQQGPEDEG
jgi:hypothetical protein